MFTRAGSSSEFDSVVALEGTLKRPDVNGEMLVDLVVMYINHKTGISYGSCKVTSSLLSKKTKKALEEFLSSAEEDYGQIAFGEGTVTSSEGSVRTLGSAEDPTGRLDPKSLGGL
jgi:hypothetical protein